MAVFHTGSGWVVALVPAVFTSVRLFSKRIPDEARSEAKKILGGVEKGENPLNLRQGERKVPTFAEVARDFIELHVAAKRKPTTKITYQQILNLHILPRIASTRMTDLTRGEVIRLHAGLSDHPYLANRCLAIISSIWNWAARREIVRFENNPAQRIERNREERRERFLTSDEIAHLGEALHEGETVGLPFRPSESKHAKPGQRRSSIAISIVLARNITTHLINAFN